MKETNLELEKIFYNEFEQDGVFQVLELKGYYAIYYRYANNYGVTIYKSKKEELFEVELFQKTYLGNKIIANTIIGINQKKIITSSMKEVNEILDKVKKIEK